MNSESTNINYFYLHKKGILFAIFYFLIVIIIILFTQHNSQADSTVNPPELWEVRSIDTMKTSRDNARVELYNTTYDTEIKNELAVIKGTGANYVAIGTPYDDEFLPYLKRWVNLARQTGIHVWFRGNWSSWEGWFNYPKNMTPEQHLTNTANFIRTHSELFADGDIFDPCPECENAGFWPQSSANLAYRDFIKKQHQVVDSAFAQIGKNVYTNVTSVIGGRAKDVMDQETLDALGNVISIDHYFADQKSISEYIDYFSNTFHTKILLAEFGAPIPDINGNMTESEQKDFINNVFEKLYEKRQSVTGINYYVLTGGTTSLLNPGGSSRQALNIVKNYFTPGVVQGRVTNTIGEPISNALVQTSDGFIIQTDKDGKYALAIPPKSVLLDIKKDGYKSTSKKITIQVSGGKRIQNFTLQPLHPNLFYRIRTKIKSIF